MRAKYFELLDSHTNRAKTYVPQATHLNGASTFKLAGPGGGRERPLLPAHACQEPGAPDPGMPSGSAGKWAGLTDKQPRQDNVTTGVDVQTLVQVGQASVTVPPKFEVHPRLQKRHACALSPCLVCWASTAQTRR